MKAQIYSGFRFLYIVGLGVIIILGAAVWIMNRSLPNTESQLSAQPEAETPADQYPEVYKFTSSYFDQILRGNYEELVLSFWAEGVENDILATCGNPLSEETRTLRQIWASCAQLREIDFDITSIQQSGSVYLVTVQFTDKNGQIVGIDLYPESVSGHQFTVYPGKSGFTVRQWNFLAPY